MAWTELNTQGLSQDELAMMNRAQERLEKDFPSVDEANLSTLLNNEWYSGISENEIVNAVSKQLH